MNDKEFTEIFKSTKKTVLSAVEKYLAVRFVYVINDVVQETYLRAFKSLNKKKFLGNSSIETWLYSIAKNESLRMNDKLIREEKKFEKFISEIETDENNTNIPYSIDIEEMYELMDQLPVKYSSVLELVSIGFSEKKIAQELSIPKGTVKSRSHKGRELLQRLWEGGELN